MVQPTLVAGRNYRITLQVPLYYQASATTNQPYQVRIRGNTGSGTPTTSSTLIATNYSGVVNAMLLHAQFEFTAASSGVWSFAPSILSSSVTIQFNATGAASPVGFAAMTIDDIGG